LITIPTAVDFLEPAQQTGNKGDPGNRRFPRMNKETESLKFTRINKKTPHRHQMDWIQSHNSGR